MCVCVSVWVKWIVDEWNVLQQNTHWTDSIPCNYSANPIRGMLGRKGRRRGRREDAINHLCVLCRHYEQTWSAGCATVWHPRTIGLRREPRVRSWWGHCHNATFSCFMTCSLLFTIAAIGMNRFWRTSSKLRALAAKYVDLSPLIHRLFFLFFQKNTHCFKFSKPHKCYS